MHIKLLSFGFKHGVPGGIDRTVDCRDLRNPHRKQELRPLTGLDQKVQDFVAADFGFDALLQNAVSDLEEGIVIGFGCHGGRHRSVAMAEFAKRLLQNRGHMAEVLHVRLALEGVK